jgi:hypothetical protein
VKRGHTQDYEVSEIKASLRKPRSLLSKHHKELRMSGSSRGFPTKRRRFFGPF